MAGGGNLESWPLWFGFGQGLVCGCNIVFQSLLLVALECYELLPPLL